MEIKRLKSEVSLSKRVVQDSQPNRIIGSVVTLQANMKSEVTLNFEVGSKTSIIKEFLSPLDDYDWPY